MWSLKTVRLWVMSGSILLGLAIGGGADAAIGHSLIVAGLIGGVGLGMILVAIQSKARASDQ
jgi:hypothetical protein